MGSQTFSVEVQPDLVEKLTHAKPVQAICELIWNGLDADAGSVSVLLVEGNLENVERIVVEDDGTAMSREEAPKLFRNLGGSWKRRGGVTRKKGRFLHGQEGRGRLKAWSLGRLVVWDIKYEKKGEVWSYSITMDSLNSREVVVSDEVRATKGARKGVKITISELHKPFTGLMGAATLQELTETFALYLSDYKDVRIRFQGERLDPAPLIENRKEFELDKVEFEGAQQPAQLELIEWKKGATRTLYLCNEHGAPLAKANTRFHIGPHVFSAYLKSPVLGSLQELGTLELAELNPAVRDLLADAQTRIKDHFRERDAEEVRTLVEEWKEERVYPFEGDAATPVERAERQVFDIVAVKVAQYVPDIEGSLNASKALHLRLLRHAIERSPDELQLILGEVLKLPKRTLQDFAHLLKDTSLTAVIGAAKIVADRLKFLVGLESILFDKGPKSRLKERSQLHRMVAQNPWIFGEEYSLSVDDQSLTEVLRKHRRLLDDGTRVDEPVKHVTKTRGIVDLVLSKAIRRHGANDLTHLVVELKAPSVVVNDKEVLQIENYALSIRRDERFKGVNVTWQFWVISDDYGPYAENRITALTGLIFDKENQKIFVKTWSQVLEDNRARLQFFQEKLEYQANKAESLAHLQDHYAAFLKGVTIDAELLEASDSENEEEPQLSVQSQEGEPPTSTNHG